MTEVATAGAPDRTSGAARASTWVVCALLALAALRVLAFVHDFGTKRFLTIDEFQWGHATWLVAEGKVPYRDFYEHHLPLGYTLHAPLLGTGEGIAADALRLRAIAFAYVVGALLVLALASLATNRSLPEVLLTLAIVPSLGFGLMSAIDYRGDNWAAFTLLAALALLEIAGRRPGRAIVALAGALVAAAVLMTQKIALLGGGAIAAMLVATAFARSERARERIAALRIPHAWTFVGAGAGVTAVAALVLAGLGILDDAFEINVLHAIEHERLYPGFEVGQFLVPYLRDTALTTGFVAAFAILYCARGAHAFWAVPLLAALVGSALVKAPFPYNFVLVCWLVAICAVRGYCGLVRRLEANTDAPARARRLAPVLYLLPLAVLPQQLGFVEGTSDNTHQLELLERIEATSGPEEAVLDSAGGALFRPNRGYHWYHGRAHVKMFRPWFEQQLVPAMRGTRAIYWIKSVRFDLLPENVQRYLLAHYVPFFGELHVLGFTTRATGPGERRTGRVDVVRAGTYHVERMPRQAEPSGVGRVVIDGVPVTGATVELTEGVHTLEIGPDSPPHRFSYLPPAAFGAPSSDRPHTPLFEFRPDHRPSRGDET